MIQTGRTSNVLTSADPFRCFFPFPTLLGPITIDRCSVVSCVIPRRSRVDCTLVRRVGLT
jgi:hypothetical protein